MAVLELDSSVLEPVKEAVARIFFTKYLFNHLFTYLAHNIIQKEKRDLYRKKVKEQKEKGHDISINGSEMDHEIMVDHSNSPAAAIPQKRPGDELERDTILDQSMEFDD